MSERQQLSSSSAISASCQPCNQETVCCQSPAQRLYVFEHAKLVWANTSTSWVPSSLFIIFIACRGGNKVALLRVCCWQMKEAVKCYYSPSVLKRMWWMATLGSTSPPPPPFQEGKAAPAEVSPALISERLKSFCHTHQKHESASAATPNSSGAVMMLLPRHVWIQTGCMLYN